MLPTAPARCHQCGRVLFTARDGRWPWHFTTKRALAARIWCVTSGTPAPETNWRAVVG